MIISMINIILATNAIGIHNGARTIHQDQSITLANLSPVNKMVNNERKPTETLTFAFLFDDMISVFN